MQELDKNKKEGLLTEDQLKVEEKKLQLDVDNANKEVDSLLSEKEKKLMTI
jgi:ribosome recycling factor